jgi:DNA-binding LytR/AlgR family response regulator
MNKPTRHPEALADRRADRRTWTFILLTTFLSWLVLTSSLQSDLARSGAQPGIEPWVREAASHIAGLVAFLIVPIVSSRYPVTTRNWMRTIPVHIFASIVFSIIHTLVMVALRKLAYPSLLDQSYTFGLHDPAVWLYEYRKDAYSYMLVSFLFVMSRSLEQHMLEAKAVRADAREKHRLTLKTGGRTLFLNTEDVIYAQAASNYVEVTTAGKTHLARMTLSELERLLAEAGTAHIRVHRSSLVHPGHVQEVIPTGDGNVKIRLDTGAELKGSRSYRDRLPG